MEIFQGIKLSDKKRKDLICFFNKYNFLDLCKSVYCINSFVANRSHFEFNMITNFILSTCKQDGNKNISKYSEFIEFIDSLVKIINPCSLYDDEIIPDCGEFKIFISDKFYSVFLGNSFSKSFPVYQSMDCIVKREKCLNSFLEYLLFQDDEINRFSFNVLPKEYSYDKFYKPSENYFDEVSNNYSQLKVSENFSYLTFSNKKDISKSHFVQHNGDLFRLFNTSFIIDAFYHLTGKDFKRFGKLALMDSAIKNFDCFEFSQNICINSGIIDDIESHKLYKDIIFPLAIFNEDSLVIFADSELWKKESFVEINTYIKNKINDKTLLISTFNGSEVSACRLDFIKEVKFISFNSNMDINDTVIPLRKEYNEYSVLDLIHMFYSARTINDLVTFFFLDDKDASTNFLSFYSGLISKFNFWVQNNKQFSRGATNYGMILTDVYDADIQLFEFYKTLKNIYPFMSPSHYFRNPFCYDYKKIPNFVEIIDKYYNYTICGSLRLANNRMLFLSMNLDLFKERNQSNLTFVETISKLNRDYFLEFEKILIEAGVYKFNVKLLLLPFDYAKKVDNNGFTKTSNQYVFSDANFYEGELLIRYTVNFEKFANDTIKENDNKVELQYFEELLSCLKNIPYINSNLIANTIKMLIGKKKVILQAKEFDYLFSNNGHGFEISNEAYAKVEKVIAIECKKIGLTQGKYKAKDFTNKIRKLQNQIIPIFESYIADFNKDILHKHLLSYLSYYLFQKDVNSDRAKLKNDQYFDDNERNECEKNIVLDNVKIKASIRFISYLIETNLAIEHTDKKKLEYEDLEFLLAFSERLVNYQDSSDSANYQLFPLELEIDQDYIPISYFSDNYKDIIKEREKRLINNVAYLPAVYSDRKHLNDALIQFKKDTGVDLVHIFNLCTYFKKEFAYTFKTECEAGVYEIPENEIIEDLKDALKDNYSSGYIDALNYLVIDEEKIKTVGNSIEKFVPLWEREKRTHRLETRPLYRSNGNIIFSPAVVSSFEHRWKDGIFNFYPPYEFGLDSLITYLREWKHECEKQMESDIASLFNAKNCYKSAKLNKLDKEGNHPLDLGDYDVLAIDFENKIVYNLEAKYLILTGSFRENYNLQDTFFNKDKKDEHFQKRIDYLEKNKEKLLIKLFKVEDPSLFKVKHFMVTNKPFYSDLKKIEFEIITYCELKKLLGINDD